MLYNVITTKPKPKAISKTKQNKKKDSMALLQKELFSFHSTS